MRTIYWAAGLLAVLAASTSPTASAAILYGVTDDDAAVPETLYILEQSNATSTFVLKLGSDRTCRINFGADCDAGEVIGYNPNDKLMYHWSGLGTPTTIMESIDLKARTVRNIPQSGDAHFEILAAVWEPANNRFLLSELLVREFGATTGGVFTSIGPFAGALDDISGLAFVHRTLFGVELFDPVMHTIDPATGIVLTTTTATAPGLHGLTLVGFNGLATDPDTGRLWAIARFNNGTRYLGTLSTGGVFSPVGPLSDKFSSLAFVFDRPVTLNTPYQIRYASNLTVGDSVINITNTGANGSSLFGPGYDGVAGNLCVNVYAFSPDEQLISCCSCLVTPNGLVHVTANNDLVSNTLTGIRPNSIVIKLVATGTGKDSLDQPTYDGSSCTNSAALAGTLFPTTTAGVLAWGTTLHSAENNDPPTGPSSSFSITETPFMPASLSADELKSISSRCANIIGNGSTFGVCRSCRVGGLGAGRK